MWLIPPETSSPSAQAWPDSTSASPELFQALSRSATSNEKHIRPSAWLRLWKQETWIRRLSGWATWVPSRRTAGQDWLTRSLQAFPVRETASPEPEAASTTPDGSGRRLDDSYASYDRATSSWRTSQGSLLSLMDEPSEESSVIWTRSGTTRNGDAYRRKPLAPPSAAIASGSSPGNVLRWPRPTKIDSRGGRNLTANRTNQDYRGLGATLIDAVRLWARPSAGNFNDSETPESWHQRADRLKEKHSNGNEAGIPLAIQAKETVGRLWSRPSHHDPRLGYQRRPEGMASLQNQQGLSTQAVDFLTGLHSRMTTKDGGPSSPPDLTSLRLNPLFDEWLLFGRKMIGWTCACPMRARVREAAGLPPSATLCAPTRPQPRSVPSGAGRSVKGPSR